MTSTPDLAAAARSTAALELVEAFHRSPGLSFDQAREILPHAQGVRLHLLSNGLDLDDLEQAATVAAVLRSLLATCDDPSIACTAAILASVEAYEHGVASAEVSS